MSETGAVVQEMNLKPIISRKTYSLLNIISCVLAFISVFCICFGIFGMAEVPSLSMYPTLEIGSKLLYISASADDLDYDDIVVFFPEIELDKPVENGLESFYLGNVKKEVIYVKRLIGLPGDVLEMKDGYVYRNGEKLDPEYVAEPMRTDGKTYTVPEGYIFCMGDNRNNSLDSRYIGAIPCNNFFGKVLFYT